MKLKIKSKIVKNASWIIGCKIVQSIMNLIVSMITARYLGPSNYGLINYASSIVAFVLPFMQLGLDNILVQEIVSSEEDEGKVIGTSIVMSVISSVICIVSVGVFTIFVNAEEITTILVCSLFSVSLLFQAMELIQYWFQAKYISKYTSIIGLIAYVCVAAYKIYLLVFGKSVVWFALSNSVDHFVISVCAIVTYYRLGGRHFSISIQTAKRLISKSKYYIISGLMVTIFANTDKIMLKLMLGEAETGYYSAAVTCAGLTGFVFAAIIDSVRPSVFESQRISKEAFEKSLSQLYCIIIYSSLAQCLLMSILAPQIIAVLYGSGYWESVNVLRLIVWYTTFSYLGTVRNIWLLAEGKQKLIMVVNLSGAFANIVLNAVLIPIIGMMGAALASLLTQMFTNVFIGFILKPIRQNNSIMIRGANPRFLKESVQKVFFKRS